MGLFGSLGKKKAEADAADAAKDTSDIAAGTAPVASDGGGAHAVKGSAKADDNPFLTPPGEACMQQLDAAVLLATTRTQLCLILFSTVFKRT
jgi:hypothetical protein